MKNKLLLILSLVALIFLASSVSASFLGTDYIYVRSDSYSNFAPYQYSSYYDNIDFQFSLYTNGFTSTVPVIVTPTIYGYNSLGTRVYLDTVPSNTFYVSPYSPYVHTYNNLFYFDEDYQSYEVVLNAQTIDGDHSTTESAYVYYQGTYVDVDQGEDQPPEETVDCSDFQISGQTDVYLTEDDQESYDLYLINNIDTPLNITSITTNDPNELDVESINYPYVLDGYLTRSAQIDLMADTVSSDYSSYIDFYVTANYDDLTCDKTFTVNYHIEDEENESSADCDDLRLKNTSFVIQENNSDEYEITLENNSFDYEYDIDEITVDDTDSLEADITSYTRNVDTDDSETIDLRVYSEEINSDTTEYLDLEIDGYMTRDGREDKRCRLRENIEVKIIDSDHSGYSSPNCEKIEITTQDISQQEDSLNDYSSGYYIYNSSNNKFTITNFYLKDNSTYANFIEKVMPSTVYASAKLPINFKLDTYSVDSTKNLNAEFSVTGYFDNGEVCGSDSIKDNFNLRIIDSEDICSMVGVENSTVSDGENQIRLFNNTNKDFTVNETLFQNENDLTIQEIDQVKTIPSNSYVNFRVGVSENTGSADMLIKGLFDEGRECDFSETKKGTLKTSDYTSEFSATDNCEFNINYSNNLEFTGNSQDLDFSFFSDSSNTGMIRIVSDNGIVSDPVIYLDAFENINKTITLNEIASNYASVDYKVKLNGCEQKIYTTNLKREMNDPISPSGSLDILSYPSNIDSINDTITSTINIKNSLNKNKTIRLDTDNFPSNWNISYSKSENMSNSNNQFVIIKNSTSTIYMRINIPQDESFDSFEGLLNIYSEESNLLSSPLVIDRSNIENLIQSSFDIDKQNNSNDYTLTLSVFNGSDSDRTLDLELYVDKNQVMVDGNTTFDAQAGKTTKHAVVVISSDSALEGSLINIKLKDSTTNRVLSETEQRLEHTDDKGVITALFSFSSTSDTVKSIVLILLIIGIISYIVYNKKNKEKKRQQIREKFENKQNIERKITEY